MHTPEIDQLELLASIDRVRHRAEEWCDAPSMWEPMIFCQGLLKRVLKRVESLQFRFEAPLVVATFGGTGTGKSALVNALVGVEVSHSGRERPTTRKPVLIAHTDTELDLLQLPLDEIDVFRFETPTLKDFVILDCPDPDTSDTNGAGTNLDRLRRLLPHCDVLLVVSTQQKYRSSRVTSELQAAAAGCRMIFVQSHADLDEDIRDDWKSLLSESYQVPELFFVDSLSALREQQNGITPSGEFGKLLQLLTSGLGASQRIRIRRANIVDLLQSGLTRSVEILDAKLGSLNELEDVLAQQRVTLSQRMAKRLQDELLTSHGLWERRLLAAVNEHWGMSPFSAVLRVYHGIGGILASLTFFRARSTAQMALLGTIQGKRWLDQLKKEQEGAEALERVSRFGLDDAHLREAEIVVSGYVQSAEFQPEMFAQHSMTELKRDAAQVESQFVLDASQQVDAAIDTLAQKNSTLNVRIWYEVLFGLYVVFVILRVGYNFFYDSLFNGQTLLSSDFYLAAGLFLILWSGLLVTTFTWRLRRGMKSAVQHLVSEMVDRKLERGLFPSLEDELRRAQRRTNAARQMLLDVDVLRNEVAAPSELAAKKNFMAANSKSS
ncbi:GTPase domain-containing protein [Thalassoglobus sp. JC818]|uniref:GTPase domain-containing protein n=1 Tax=Thalassoglobus sp. JC818 TaxID=3232136 RepID=UPI00345AB217